MAKTTQLWLLLFGMQLIATYSVLVLGYTVFLDDEEHRRPFDIFDRNVRPNFNRRITQTSLFRPNIPTCPNGAVYDSLRQRCTSSLQFPEFRKKRYIWPKLK